MNLVSNAKIEPVLTEGDRLSVTALKLQRHFDKRLEDCRKQNEAALSEVDTARIRGRILEIKYLLSLFAEPQRYE